MRRLFPDDTIDDVIAYNLRDGGTAVSFFAETQPDRVRFARLLISRAVEEEGGRRLTIVEPGCSSGDISGFFSEDHTAIGFDVSPAAVAATRDRWPQMQVWEGQVEDVTPMTCDVLVLCEFLEHVMDPLGLVKAWLPLAKHVVIGHPLVGDHGHDEERGHVWAYDQNDFFSWFPLGGHDYVESSQFAMPGYERMVLGRGRRASV